jgi:hypothetical protein
MVEDNFRTSRRRDPLAPGSADSPAPGPLDDPLAELARLIGQSEPMDDFGRDGRRASAYSTAEAEPAADWAADDNRYAEPDEPAEAHYPAYPPALPARDEDYDLPVASPKLNSIRDDGRGYARIEQPAYRDEQSELSDRPLPAFLPRTRDVRYEDDDQEREAPDDRYAMEDYDDEAADSPRRRAGLVVVAAVLGLAVLGTAGAFAYRAMFGGSMLPSLPPIIKADNGPNKIVPSAGNGQGSATDQGYPSGSGAAEKLVSREEQPVDVPAPVNAAPRVVSTIPIFPAPTAGPPGGQSSAAMTPGFPAPVAPAPATVPAAPAVPAASAGPPLASPEPKKIHTIAIRPDQPNVADAAAAATTSLPPPARSAAPRPTGAPASAPPPAVPKPAPPPAPVAGANAPLSIVPSQGEVQPAAPARNTRTALARPTTPAATVETAPAAAPGGGYAVQVTSQRSEAEAQTAFSALRAKFPGQLGGREPIVRRADLGDKGVFYRALVGPFASMEQAAGVCSSLKAAGGNCIVQKN